MKDKYSKRDRIPVILIISSIFMLFGCSSNELDDNKIRKEYKQKEINRMPEKDKEYAVEAPPFSDGIFPCSDCHAYQISNPKRRELVDWHDEISASFNHDNENRWCLDCHDLISRDSLRLASGKLLDFKESYKLCGQCHGEKYRDWKVGVHGKRTGYWNGKKEYFLCVNCHNPHSPKFNELTPEPPPIRQEDIR